MKKNHMYSLFFLSCDYLIFYIFIFMDVSYGKQRFALLTSIIFFANIYSEIPCVCLADNILNYHAYASI